MDQFRYVLIRYNADEPCRYDGSYYIEGVYKNYSEALNKIKSEIKKLYDDLKNIDEKTYDGEFMNGFRNLYDLSYKETLLYSILEIKV